MKYLKLIFITILVLCPISVFASTRTFTRTKEKPLVPGGVAVNDATYPYIEKTPAIDTSEKIYDFADLFSSREENLLYKQIDDYIRSTTIDVVIVTVNDLKELSLDTYTSCFYRYNDFLKNGIVFSIYYQDDMSIVYMDVFGSDALSKYTEMRKQQILNSIYSAIQQEQYYDSMSRAIVTLNGFYRAKESGNYVIGEDGTVYKYIPWLQIGIISFSFTFILVLGFLYKISRNNHLKYRDDLKDKIDSSTLEIQTEIENFVGNIVVGKK